MNELIPRKKAAAMLCISVVTLKKICDNGDIAYVQHTKNGCVYFTEEALNQYVAGFTRRMKPLQKS